jgi:hypothetical protein
MATKKFTVALEVVIEGPEEVITMKGMDVNGEWILNSDDGESVEG